MSYFGGYFGTPSAGTPGVGPTITVVSPTPGAEPGAAGGFPADFNTAKDTEIVLQITDTDGLRDVVVLATFLNYPTIGNNIIEGIYRRGSFLGNYVKFSFQVTITNGIELHCRRTDGWPVGTDTLGDIQFSVDAIDDTGALT